MERRVKERLVGATILVVLIVLIVPELFSGPKRAVLVAPPALPGSVEPMRSVTVDLATSKAIAGTDEAAASAASAVDESPSVATPDGTSRRDADGASPAATAPPSARSTGAMQQSAESHDSGDTSPKPGSQAAQAVVAQAASPTEGTHRGWMTQVGSFASRANADKLERQLRASGFTPVVASSGTGAGARYRVRVGPLADRAAAGAMLTKLKRAGFPASIVPP